MTAIATPELKIFYCYAHEDQEYREQLDRHMAHLKRRYNLKTWFDREILPGENWEAKIEEHLKTANLIFLLISPDFMDSDYCYNKEMMRALHRHNQGEAMVIPIIVRWVYWNDAPFSSIQVLPLDARPICDWPNLDKAFYDVVMMVERVIQVLLAAMQKRRQENQLGVLIQQKQYFAAKDFLQRYESEISVATAQSSTVEIEQKIRDAQLKQAKLEQALKTHTIDLDEHITRFLEIEDICQDLPGIEKLRVSPSPPSSLQALLQGNLVRLSWQPSTTPNVFYTIVRKSQSRPATAMDGTVLKTHVPACTYEDDVTAEVGIPLYYAVYSGYREVQSTTGAALEEPVLIAQTVLAVSAKAGNQQIDLSWEVPPHAHSVVVVCKEQMPPDSISDGLLLDEYSPATKQMTDYQVQNDQTYHYALFCRFKAHDGKLITSEGVYISAVPEPPPLPIQHLDISSAWTGQEYEITLRCPSPGRGALMVKRTKEAYPFPSGSVLPEDQLDKYGEDNLKPDQGLITEQWPEANIAYYTPIVYHQGMAYIGNSQAFACVGTITNLEIENLGDELKLKWTFPYGCQYVEMASGSKSFPDLNDPQTQSTRIDETQYKNLGGHVLLSSNTDQDFFISMRAIFLLNDKKVATEVIERQATQRKFLMVAYDVKRTSLSREYVLHITMDRSPGILPKMCLVFNGSNLPMDKADGTSIHLEGGGKVWTRAEYAEKLPERMYLPGTFVRLFLEEEEVASWVKIIRSDQEKLRLL